MSDTRRVVLVTGLSGAGKSSILHALEDAGLEAIDNPPLPMLAALAGRREGGDLAIGVDVRTSGFDQAALVALLGTLRGSSGLRPELIYATADDTVLQRRYTATRRRHPMAPAAATVADGIAAERALIAPLRALADWVIDTSELSAVALRRLIEARFAPDPGGEAGLALSLVSFAFPAGLPREADMVFDVRFLRNPFYDAPLSSGTGLDGPVAAFVHADPGYQPFLDSVVGLLRLVLPRFVAEGKKYATVAVGCSGGRHRSVTVVEALSRSLRAGTGPNQPGGWSIIVTHRELAQAVARLAQATAS